MNSDKDIQKAIDGIILYRLNSEKGEGKTLAKEFAVRYLPTFAMINGSGANIDRWIGFEKSEWLESVAGVLSDPATVDEKVTRFQSAPDTKTAAALAHYSVGMLQYKDAVNYYTRAQELKSDTTTDYTFSIFRNVSDGVDAKAYTFDDARNAANAYLASPLKTGDQVNYVVSQMIQLAKSSDRQEDLAKYLQTGLDFTAKSADPEMKKEHDILMIDYSLYIKKDTASAVEFKKATMPDNWTKDPDKLNEFAWWCFENNTNLKEAEKLARNAVGLAKPGRGKANIYDTLAEIENAKGNAREAADLSKKAVAEDPGNKYFPTQVTRFEELAKAKTK